MNPIYIQLRKHVLIPLSLILILIMAVSSTIFYQHQVHQWEENQKTLNQQLNDHFVEAMEANVSKMELAIDTFEHSQKIIDAYQQQNREQLYQNTISLYRELNQKHHITHFYFTNLDRTNFLRVHQKDHFGDVISRRTMVKAQQNQSASWGIEIGPLGTYTLRLVKPLYSDGHSGNVIGYIELGMEIEHALAHLAEEMNIDLAVLLKKSAIDRNLWKSGIERLGRSADWDLFNHMVTIYSSKYALPTVVVNHIDTQGAELKPSYAILTDEQDHTSNVGFVPFHSINKNQHGTLIAVTDITPLADELTQQIETILIICLVISLLYIIILNAYLNRIEHSIYRSMKEAEEEIRESEARLKEAQRLGQIGNWVLDLKQKRLDWSNEIYELFGLTPRFGSPLLRPVPQSGPPG